MTEKKSESKAEKKSAEDAPQADPAQSGPEVDAVAQASGEAVKGESGSQEGWRERHGAEGSGEAAPPA
jgi:hypothetical protein